MSVARLTKIEFGDFQTPLELARKTCALIKHQGFSPKTIIEPSCGKGNFLLAGMETFSAAERVLGIECNSEYALSARANLSCPKSVDLEILERDFFQTDWKRVFASSIDPILILGNPPWVTNAVLGSLQSSNLPEKKNSDNLRGVDAITGKANFDISEWMLRENLNQLSSRSGMLAVLCKTSVARKVLKYVWSQELPFTSASIYKIDAKEHFNASVDACFFCIETSLKNPIGECAIYDSLDSSKPSSYFGFCNGEVVANSRLYRKWQHLHHPGLHGWRSGVKHDCSKVFELKAAGLNWRNGLGETVDVEENVIYPLLKSSDVFARRPATRRIIVPNKSMTESPEVLKHSSPKAWKYLCSHASFLAGRASSIYKKRPAFSVFGVGPYTFAPWKVAISGLYKTLKFSQIGPHDDKPTLLDDTCYLFPCNTQSESEILVKLYESEIANDFFQSLIFWDAKRPITAKYLNMLDLAALANETGIKSPEVKSLSERQIADYKFGQTQPLLFQ
ncbi:MAG: hypothetical protein MI725_17805 [Pirellulales bacterium]|nr:hypothetical protein [Pirellulales bacterium]